MLKTYVHRPHIEACEAVQVTAGNVEDLRQANGGPFPINANEGPVPGVLGTIKCGEGPVEEINEGDYLIKRKNGTCTLVRREHFEINWVEPDRH